jgi:hypothetical protein
VPKISNGKPAKREDRKFTIKRRKSDFKSSGWYAKAASSISAAKVSTGDASQPSPAPVVGLTRARTRLIDKAI